MFRGWLSRGESDMLVRFCWVDGESEDTFFQETYWSDFLLERDPLDFDLVRQLL